MTSEIYIGGHLVSVADDGDYPVLLTRSAADAQDPASSKADRSFTVRLVNDDAAKRALASAWRADALGTFQKLAAIENSQVYAGGELLLDGLFFLTAVNEQTVEGFFVAAAKSFAQAIAGLSISQLPLRSFSFRGVPTQNAVNAEFETAFANDRLENFGYDCLFPFALFGFNFLPNYWGADTNRLLSATSFQSEWGTTVNLPPSRPILEQNTWAVDVGSVGHIDFRAVPPAFLLTRIVKAIIESAGYAAGGSFFTDPTARKTVVWGGVEAEWNWIDLATGEWNMDNQGLRLFMFADFIAVQYVMTDFSSAPSSYDRDWISAAPHPFNAAWTDEAGAVQGFWRVIARRLTAFQQVRDFAFAMRSTAFWRAPADGVYTFTLTLDVIGFSMPTCWPADGSRAGVGLTLCPEGEEPEYLDGNWLGGGPDLEGWENVLDIEEVTGNGPIVLTATRLLRRGDAVVAWAGLTHWTANQVYSVNVADFAPAPPVPEILMPDDFTIDRTFGTANEVFNVLYVEAAPDARFEASVNLHPARSLPDLPQSDFLAAVRRAFNLFIDVNERNRTVSVDFVQGLFLAPDPSVDLTRAVDRSTVQLKPPNVAQRFDFAWGDDSADYAGQQVDGLEASYETGVQVNPAAQISGSPLTVAAVETVRVLAAANPGSFVNPVWFVSTDFDTARISTEDAYFAPVNSIEEPAEFALKLAVLDTVDGLWGINVPLARAFDLTQPLGSRDLLTNWTTRYQFTNAPLKWGAMIDRYWFRWIEATAAGHTLEAEAWLTASQFAAITVRATVIVDGVDYALIEARGFNPSRAVSRTRLKLARK